MIVAGTGHRPDRLGGFGEDVFQRLVRLAQLVIAERAPSKVISGMALGWDQALAVAAYRAGTPFVAAIPFRGQERRWPERSQERYRKLLSVAAEVVTLSEGGFSAAAMHARNYWMVDHADEVWALHNGDQTGGTANCLRYAERAGVRVVPLWDRWML